MSSSEPRPGRDNAWLQTFTGRRFWPLDPKAEEIDIRDIAHALSNQCRFAGHTTDFYSVAQHSVRVSFVVPPELALCGLLHDASEAYLLDIPRPLKRLPMFEPYREYEERLMHMIAEKFGFTWPMPEEIRAADDNLLMDEAKSLIRGPKDDWALKFDPKGDTCADLGATMLPRRAESLFLARFCSLTAGAYPDETFSERMIQLMEPPVVPPNDDHRKA